jgi:hypothetical protein
MDRAIVYVGAIPEDTDLLLTNKNIMIALGMAAQAILGTSTLVDGLACTPTGPASLEVIIGQGSIYAQENVDGTAYGSLEADTTHQIVKQGINLGSINLTCAAPGTAGQSINYLIQVAYQDFDAGSTVLPYYNADNPAVAFNGPNNTGTSQNTIRQGNCVIQAKAGIAATTGTQTTPSADAGFTGLWVVTVANGQTAIMSGGIVAASGAPFITEKLNDKISIVTGDARYLRSGKPAGRLTLTSGAPVLAADTTGQGTIYYTPYVGNNVPIYNGTQFSTTSFAELSQALDSASGHTGYHQSGKIFDVFAFNNGGVVTLGTGPAWSSNTSRGTGAGTTQLQSILGIFTNAVSINLKTDTTSARVTVPTNQATYLGSFVATADGQTGMAFTPTPASGGTANVLGLYNAHNRVSVASTSIDSTSNWTYATATTRPANGSSNNSVTWLDGLQQSSINATYVSGVAMSGGTNGPGSTGVGLNSTTAMSGIAADFFIAGSISCDATIPATLLNPPLLGLNTVTALENARGGLAASFYGSGLIPSAQAMGLTLKLEM